MEKGNLRVKFSHGEITIELESESSTVLTELRSLKKDGTGKLLEFFGVATIQHSTTTQPQQHEKITSHTTIPRVDVKGFPPLNDIVLKGLPKSESEWIVVYAHIASNGGKKTFTREELWGQYKSSERDTKGRRDNLTNSITQAVSKNWLSNISEDTFSLIDDGVAKAKEIVSREKSPKKRIVKPRSKKTTKEGKA